MGWDLGLEGGIWASRLGFGPQDWNLGLEAGIWASRLRNGPGGWGDLIQKDAITLIVSTDAVALFTCVVRF